MRGRDVLKEVVEAIRRLSEDPEFVVSRKRVLRWAASEDLEALGALASLLFDSKLSRRIEPNLTLPDYMAVTFPYLERCFRENPRGDWADSRWSAGGFLANWIKDVWADERFRPAVDDFRVWLTQLYKSADDPDLRTCLVQATLEHLFEVEGIVALFSNWRDDPELRPAYEEAKLWKERFDEISRLPQQSEASTAVQAAALEQEVAAQLPHGSTKDSVIQFLRAREIRYHDLPEMQFLAGAVGSMEAGVVGKMDILFWFDARGRLTRHWIGNMEKYPDTTPEWSH